MKQAVIFSLAIAFVFPIGISAAAENATTAMRDVDVKSSDGTVLKGSYFAATKPGPGVLLFHQSNRTRKSWEDVARRLAADGINTLTIDTDPNKPIKQRWPGELDAAFEFLVSQPGVNRDVIGIGGAGVIGVENGAETARRHADQVKSLVLMSGEAFPAQLRFLHDASQLPGLFVVSDDDEYPPIQQEMQLVYDTSTSPSKKLIYYSAAKVAPWLWYEPIDVGKVPANGGHGTDLFKAHPELVAIIVNWFETTLIKTPGHAPADNLACAATLNQLQLPGGATQVEKQLVEARKKDPQAQLFPEVTVSSIAQGFMREGDAKSAIEVLKLLVLAYPDSADAHDNLADVSFEAGQTDLAREHAEKALAILNDHKFPASSWTDTEQYRGEIRRDCEKILKQVAEKK